MGHIIHVFASPVIKDMDKLLKLNIQVVARDNMGIALQPVSGSRRSMIQGNDLKSFWLQLQMTFFRWPASKYPDGLWITYISSQYIYIYIYICIKLYIYIHTKSCDIHQINSCRNLSIKNGQWFPKSWWFHPVALQLTLFSTIVFNIFNWVASNLHNHLLKKFPRYNHEAPRMIHCFTEFVPVISSLAPTAPCEATKANATKDDVHPCH